MDPKVVDIERGVAWISCGWRLVGKNTGVWVVFGIFLFVILGISSLQPVVGLLVGLLIFPVFIGGMLYGAHEIRQGRPLLIEHLFHGFKDAAKLKPLLLLGVIALVAGTGSVAIFGIFMGPSLILGMLDSGAAHNMVLLRNSLITLLLVSLVQLVAVLLLYFAIPLVVLRHASAGAAMRSSVRACLKNVLPLFVFSLVYVLLAIVATLPFMLGWLILLPWSVAMLYCSFEDIYPS